MKNLFSQDFFLNVILVIKDAF